MAWLYVVIAGLVAAALGGAAGGVIGYQWGTSDGRQEEKSHRAEQEMRLSRAREDRAAATSRPWVTSPPPRARARTSPTRLIADRGQHPYPLPVQRHLAPDTVIDVPAYAHDDTTDAIPAMIP